jgi:hypothetical protein
MHICINVFLINGNLFQDLMPGTVTNISNQTMRTRLDFKSEFDQVRGEFEDWIKIRGLEN